MSEWIESGVKTYEIKQIDDRGTVLSSSNVEAGSGEAAAKQLRKVVDGTRRIEVCLDGAKMNEMGVDYWLTRMRRR